MKVCPSCSAHNPSENKFCGQCGTRLPAESETSVPTANPQAQPSNQFDTEAHRPEQPKSEADAPDWLRKLYTSSPRPAETTLVGSSSDDLPDWLRAMEEPDVSQRSDEPTPATTQQRETQPADTSLGSTGVSQTDAAPPISQELPDWLLQEEPTTATTAEQEVPRSDDGRQQDTELPPWLLDEDVPASQAAQPTSVPTTQELPAWLLEDTPEPPASPPDRPSADSALPPWLLDQHPSWTDEPVQTSIAAEQQPPAWHLPPWLVDTLPATVDDASSRPTTKLPAWLTEDLPQSDAGTQVVTDTAATQSLPSGLLKDDIASTEAIEPHAASPAVTQELPSWLLEEAPETRSDQSEPASPAVQASSTSAELPAWLLEDTTTPPQTNGGTTDDTLPPWLREDEIKSGAIAPGGALIYDTPEQQPPRRPEPEHSQPFDTSRQGSTHTSTLPSSLHEEAAQPSQATSAHPSTAQTTQGHGAPMEMAVAPPATQRSIEPATGPARSPEPTEQPAAQDEALAEGGSSHTLVYLFIGLLVLLALVLLWLAAFALGLI